jgi:hypothetical protein
MAAFTREATCPECAREYLISGASVNPGTETEAPRRFRCECGGWLEVFIPGSVNLERVTVTARREGTSNSAA